MDVVYFFIHGIILRLFDHNVNLFVMEIIIINHI